MSTSLPAIDQYLRRLDGLPPSANEPEEGVGKAFLQAARHGKRDEVRSFLRQLDEIPNEYLGLALEAAVETQEVLRVQSMLGSVEFMDLIDPESLGRAIEKSADNGSYAVLDCLLKNPRIIEKAPNDCYGTALQLAAVNNHAAEIKLLFSRRELVEQKMTQDQFIAALEMAVDEEQPNGVRTLLQSGYYNNTDRAFLAKLLYECANHQDVEVAKVLFNHIDFGQFMGKEAVDFLLETVIVAEHLDLLTLLLGFSWVTDKFDQIDTKKVLNIAASSSANPLLVEVLLDCEKFARQLNKKDLIIAKTVAERNRCVEIASALDEHIRSHFSLKRRADQGEENKPSRARPNSE